MIIDLNANIHIIEPEENENLVIGFFDGIHHGHMKLFDDNLENTSVLTFTNHPNKKNMRLYSDLERYYQLNKIGVKRIFVYDLSENITSVDFVEKYIKKINPKEIIVGENFFFGSDKKEASFLKKYYNTRIISVDNDISTSKIKELIINGKIKEANDLLLWPYYRNGIIEKGQQIGRKLFVKTANMPIDNELIPIQDGIYTSKTKLGKFYYKSVSFIGKSKTISSDKEPMIETNLINYDDHDFYSEKIKVIFYEKISDIKKYYFKFLLFKRIKKLIKIASEYEWFKSKKN